MTGFDMNIGIGPITSGQDTNISILLYIKVHIVIEQEIYNIKSGRSTNVRLNTYFQNSPDFQKLQHRIAEQKEKLALLINTNQALYQLEVLKLENLNQASQLFQESALRLADTFLQINTQSPRLKQARSLFEQGKIREADNLLLEEDLIIDQDSLLAQLRYFKQRKKDILALLHD
jgi:hypothetical protein